MASAKLEQLVLTAKGQRGIACRSAIQQALDSPHIHVFGELLSLPSVQALKEAPEHKAYFQLLEIFAYGSYPDYKAAAGMPELTPEMLLKLKLLTIVQLGSISKVLPYKDLIAALDVASLRDLEDIIIEAIYRKLIGGKLDQKNQQLSLDFVIGRDLKDGDLDRMINVLDNWCENCEVLLGKMEEKMTFADKCKEADQAAEAKLLEEIEATKATLKTVDKSDGRDNSLRDHDMDGFEDSGMRMGGMRSNRRDYARAK